jgi:hypothetical protein
MKTRTNRGYRGATLSVIAASIAALGTLAASCSYDWTVTEDETATSSSSSGNPSGSLTPCSCPACIRCGETACSNDVAECVRYEQCASLCGGEAPCEDQCMFDHLSGYVMSRCLEAFCSDICAACVQGQ